MSKSTRIAALMIALTAWGGLVIQFLALIDGNGSAARSLMTMLIYFTITTNLLIAVMFTAISFKKEPRFAPPIPSILAGCALSILLVGVIFALLLQGLVELSGGSAIANHLLHQVTPIAVPLFWLFLVPKGTLRPKDPLLWAVYPLAYLIFALARGSITGSYAYPFLNADNLGWSQVGTSSLLIAVGFLLAAYLLVLLDGRLAPHAK